MHFLIAFKKTLKVMYLKRKKREMKDKATKNIVKKVLELTYFLYFYYL